MDLNKFSLKINETYSLLINPIVHHSSFDAIAFFNIDGIQHVNVIKYLGIEIDSLLNFNLHIDNVQPKTAKIIGIFSKLNKILTPNALLKPGLHEPQLPVERSVALVFSIVVEQSCCALKSAASLDYNITPASFKK